MSWTSQRTALVTNDDGIDSPGLRALAEAAAAVGLDPLVAAPRWDSSGASASITGVHDGMRLAIEDRQWPDWAGPVHAAEATPALIAWLGVRGAFGRRPDFVVVGINRGPNVGRAVLHSGTVGAALTAYNHGVTAVAVSLAAEDEEEPCQWATASDVARRCIAWAMVASGPVVLNCNVPNVTLDELGNLQVAPLASVGAVETTITDRTAGSVRVQVAGDPSDPAPGTDARLLRAGVPTVTALRPVVEDAALDLTDLAPRHPSPVTVD